MAPLQFLLHFILLSQVASLLPAVPPFVSGDQQVLLPELSTVKSVTALSTVHITLHSTVTTPLSTLMTPIIISHTTTRSLTTVTLTPKPPAAAPEASSPTGDYGIYVFYAICLVLLPPVLWVIVILLSSFYHNMKARFITWNANSERERNAKVHVGESATTNGRAIAEAHKHGKRKGIWWITTWKKGRDEELGTWNAAGRASGTAEEDRDGTVRRYRTAGDVGGEAV